MAEVPVFGIVGRWCAGKDTATRWFVDRGWHEINVDAVGHEALAALAPAVIAAFGPTVSAPDGASVDRRALGTIVFGDANARRRLEAIVHPWMRQRVRERAAALVAAGGQQPAGVVINAALLVYMDLHPLCDTVVLVDAPLLTRVRRARERDGLSLRRVVQRLWSQRALPAQVRAARADTISVANGSTPGALFAQLEQLV